jgi:hypothetical protein
MSKWSSWYKTYRCSKCDTEQSDFGAGHICSTCGSVDTSEIVVERHKLLTPWWMIWNRVFKIQRKYEENED